MTPSSARPDLRGSPRTAGPPTLVGRLLDDSLVVHNESHI